MNTIYTMIFASSLLSLPLFAKSTENQSGFQVSKMLADGAFSHDTDELPKGKVLETIDVDGYTYFKFQNGEEADWAATAKLDLPKGSNVVLMKSYPMYDFKSKTLDRTFKKILFVSSLDIVQ